MTTDHEAADTAADLSSASEQSSLDSRLSPGAGRALYELACGPAGRGRHAEVYQLLSRISSAIRERASDQSRSAVRSDTARDSAVSATVKPAK